MEFVSTDRSRDAEYTRGLQNYNRQVLENNQDIAARIDDSKDQLDKDLANAQEVADLTTMKTTAALGGVGAGALEKGARAKTEYGKAKIKAAAEKAKEARGGATEVAVTAEEELAGPGGRFGPGEQLLGDPAAESAALESFEQEQEGIGDFYRTQAGRPGSPTRTRPTPEFSEQEQADFRQGIEERGAAREAAAAGEESVEVGEKVGKKVTEEAAEKAAGGAGKVIGKLAGGVARGAGVAGAALSAGTAIEGLMAGKKFEWDKQGLEIGGAILDILGTGAEFIPGGQLIGVGLQLAGTAASTAGSAVEAFDIEPDQTEAERQAKELQSKTQSDLEAERKQVISRVTQAGAGGAAVAREQQ
jgi:hypothetical protein